MNDNICFAYHNKRKGFGGGGATISMQMDADSHSCLKCCLGIIVGKTICLLLMITLCLFLACIHSFWKQ